MITFHNVEQRSPEWYAMREGKWTGSTVIHLLRGKKNPPPMSDFDNLHMKRGRVLENLALEGYQQESHYFLGTKYGKLRIVGFITNDLYPNAGYSPDAIYGRRVIEVKCLTLEKHDSINNFTDLPLEYKAQVQFGLLITGYSTADVVLYNPDSERPLKIITVRKSRKIWDNIKRLLQK